MDKITFGLLPVQEQQSTWLISTLSEYSNPSLVSMLHRLTYEPFTTLRESYPIDSQIQITNSLEDVYNIRYDAGNHLSS